MTSEKKCKVCGEYIDKDSNYCYSCGSPQRNKLKLAITVPIIMLEHQYPTLDTTLQKLYEIGVILAIGLISWACIH